MFSRHRDTPAAAADCSELTFSSGHDQHLRWESHPVVRKEFGNRRQHLFRNLSSFRIRKLLQLSPQSFGYRRSHLPKLRGRNRRGNVEFQNALTHINPAGTFEYAGQLAGFRKTKSAGCVRIGGRRFDVPGHDVRYHGTEGVNFTQAPDDKCDPAVWFSNPKHLATVSLRIRKEHRTQPAYRS